jgi:hypothetical protein
MIKISEMVVVGSGSIRRTSVESGQTESEFRFLVRTANSAEGPVEIDLIANLRREGSILSARKRSHAIIPANPDPGRDVGSGELG